jgi:glutamate formiminotransferase
VSSDWIECIPNFSEGRDADIIHQLEAAVKAVPGVLLLDRNSDPDHNRTVLTFVGPPELVARAAFETIHVASSRIDLSRHQGTHPFIGAADVVPFVPLPGGSLPACAAIARTIGLRVGEELDLPVFLYEAAALRPERTTLEVIRRGGYDALRRSIGEDSLHTPDFGPSRMGAAGAVIIGARAPLIAFNIFLASKDAAIARNIARRIRASSGGLPGVKALGMIVAGQAQVSMNITDYHLTSLATIFEGVRHEAEAMGTNILRSEFIGLVPREALPPGALERFKVEPLSANPVLEDRIASISKESGKSS